MHRNALLCFSCDQLEHSWQKKYLHKAQPLHRAFAIFFLVIACASRWLEVFTVPAYSHQASAWSATGVVLSAVVFLHVYSKKRNCSRAKYFFRLGLARTSYIVWAGSVQQLLCTDSRVFRYGCSPILHCCIAAVLAKVPLHVHLLVQSLSSIMLCWLLYVIQLLQWPSHGQGRNAFLPRIGYQEQVAGAFVATLLALLQDAMDRQAFVNTMLRESGQPALSPEHQLHQWLARLWQDPWGALGLAAVARRIRHAIRRTRVRIPPNAFASSAMELHYQQMTTPTPSAMTAEAALALLQALVLSNIANLSHAYNTAVVLAAGGAAAGLAAVQHVLLLDGVRLLGWLAPLCAACCQHGQVSSMLLTTAAVSICGSCAFAWQRKGGAWSQGGVMCLGGLTVWLAAYTDPAFPDRLRAVACLLCLSLLYSCVLLIRRDDAWRQHMLQQHLQPGEASPLLYDRLPMSVIQCKDLLQQLQHSAHAAHAVETLCRMAEERQSTYKVLLCLGMQQALCKAMRDDEEACVLHALRLILSLSSTDAQVLRDMFGHGLLDDLTHVARRSTSSSVALGVSYAMATLADTHECHVALVEAGMLQTVLSFFGRPDVSYRAAATYVTMVLLSVAREHSVVATQVADMQLLPLLVEAAAGEVQATQDHACSALAFAAVSQHEKLVQQLLAAGGLGALLRRVVNPCDPMAATAAAAIAKLALHTEVAREQAVEMGAVALFVRVMTHGSEDGRAFAMYALEALVRPQDRRAGADFVGAQGVPSLVGMMVEPQEPSQAAARASSGASLLGNLYATQPSIQQHVQAASRMGLPMLQVLLHSDDPVRTQAAMAQILLDSRLRGGSTADSKAARAA